jgi:hypothetical protein
MLAHDEPKKLNAMIRDRISRLGEPGRNSMSIIWGDFATRSQAMRANTSQQMNFNSI